MELVADRFQFTEGPQWMEDDGVLLFTDAGRAILQVGPDDEISDFRRPSDGANGLAVDTEGRLLAAENMARRVTRTESDGTVTPIAEQFEGVRLNQPNDIAVRSDGTIYFTDPYYGDGTTELDFHGVFRIAPDGTLTAERRGAITEQPNGVALSPDETPALRLQPGGRPGVGFRRRRRRRPVRSPDIRDHKRRRRRDGRRRRRQPVRHHRQRHRGLRSRRHTLGHHPGTPGWAANCAFGGPDGRTLYITAGEELYRVTLAQPGPY